MIHYFSLACCTRAGRITIPCIRRRRRLQPSMLDVCAYRRRPDEAIAGIIGSAMSRSSDAHFKTPVRNGRHPLLSAHRDDRIGGDLLSRSKANPFCPFIPRFRNDEALIFGKRRIVSDIFLISLQWGASERQRRRRRGLCQRLHSARFVAGARLLN